MSDNWFAIYSQCTNFLLSASSWSEIMIIFSVQCLGNFQLWPILWCYSVWSSFRCPGRFSHQSESRNANELDLFFHWTNNVWDWRQLRFSALNLYFYGRPLRLSGSFSRLYWVFYIISVGGNMDLTAPMPCLVRQNWTMTRTTMLKQLGHYSQWTLEVLLGRPLAESSYPLSKLFPI